MARRKQQLPISEHQMMFVRMFIDAVKHKKELPVESVPMEAIHGYLELVADDMGLPRPKFPHGGK